MQWSALPEEKQRINMLHENDENKLEEGEEGGQLPAVSLVDGIRTSNQMAKHRSVVSSFCRVHNVASACNAGGSSSLHTRMNATV
jgi:hypothetical protein